MGIRVKRMLTENVYDDNHLINLNAHRIFYEQKMKMKTRKGIIFSGAWHPSLSGDHGGK